MGRGSTLSTLYKKPPISHVNRLLASNPSASEGPGAMGNKTGFSDNLLCKPSTLLYAMGLDAIYHLVTSSHAVRTSPVLNPVIYTQELLHHRTHAFIQQTVMCTWHCARRWEGTTGQDKCKVHKLFHSKCGKGCEIKGHLWEWGIRGHGAVREGGKAFWGTGIKDEEENVPGRENMSERPQEGGLQHHSLDCMFMQIASYKQALPFRVLLSCCRMLSFKPTISPSSFTFINRLFSSSLSTIRVVSSAYLRLLIFQ